MGACFGVNLFEIAILTKMTKFLRAEGMSMIWRSLTLRIDKILKITEVVSRSYKIEKFETIVGWCDQD